jgi:C-terminal peptidase prc
MKKSGIDRQRNYWWIGFGILFAVVFLVGISPTAVQGQEESNPIPNPPRDPSADRRALQSAAQAIAKGEFDEASGYLSLLSETGSHDSIAEQIRTILAEQKKLQEQVSEARQSAYREYLTKMEEEVQLALWRKKLLDASIAYDWTGEVKRLTETQWQKEIREHWLDSLVELRFAKDLAKRTGITEQVDPQTRAQIIEQSLAIGRRMIREGEKEIQQKLEKNLPLDDVDVWLKAYSQVYQFLVGLEPENEEYEQEGQKLLRKAIISSMYVPDPNQVAVPWEQRREGVTFTVYSDGLKRLIDRYVEEPDFRKMTDDALRNCLLLAQTSNVVMAFEQLQDESARNRYIEAIEALKKKLAKTPKEYLGYPHLLEQLRSVQRINNESLQFPEEVIIAEFAEGSFSALDGYTYIVWPGDVRGFRKDMTGEFSGIGIEIGKVDGILTVNSLLEGGPAEQAGLDAGDKIMAVDGKSTTNITLEMAVQRITGKEGTLVLLTVDRKDFKKPRDFAITRGKIVVHTVKGLYRDADGHWQHFVDKDKGIAYVRLTNFYSESTESLRNTLKTLQGQGMQALILDLRNNSGGFLSTAIEVADTFIPSGVIVSTRARQASEASYDWARNENTFDSKLPIVVLVNVNSASASEIVSGAIKDHRRGLVVGTRTFGKGNVQTIMGLSDAAQLKMTIAYYYLPSDRRVHRDLRDKTNEDYGVEPNVKVELAGTQIETLRRVQREAGILRRNHVDSTPEENSRNAYGPEEILESDPQLSIATACLQGSLLTKRLGEANIGELVGPVLESTPATN